MKKTITIPIEFDAETLAMELADNLSYDEAINIIKIIDNQMADWGFTKQLAAFFMNEVLKEWSELEGYPDVESDIPGGIYVPPFEIYQFIEENLPKSV